MKKMLIVLAMVFLLIIGWSGHIKARTTILVVPNYGPDPYEQAGEVIGSALAAGCVHMINSANARRESAPVYNGTADMTPPQFHSGSSEMNPPNPDYVQWLQGLTHKQRDKLNAEYWEARKDNDELIWIDFLQKKYEATKDEYTEVGK